MDGAVGAHSSPSGRSLQGPSVSAVVARLPTCMSAPHARGERLRVAEVSAGDARDHEAVVVETSSRMLSRRCWVGSRWPRRRPRRSSPRPGPGGRDIPAGCRRGRTPAHCTAVAAGLPVGPTPCASASPSRCALPGLRARGRDAPGAHRASPRDRRGTRACSLRRPGHRPAAGQREPLLRPGSWHGACRRSRSGVGSLPARRRRGSRHPQAAGRTKARRLGAHGSAAPALRKRGGPRAFGRRGRVRRTCPPRGPRPQPSQPQRHQPAIETTPPRCAVRSCLRRIRRHEEPTAGAPPPGTAKATGRHRSHGAHAAAEEPQCRRSGHQGSSCMAMMGYRGDARLRLCTGRRHSARAGSSAGAG